MKLKLKLEALDVVSFDTRADSAGQQGTVRANEYDASEFCTRAITCYTCDLSCEQGGTCGTSCFQPCLTPNC
jgi:hypothetical protein